jgi:hypothetical protein
MNLQHLSIFIDVSSHIYVHEKELYELWAVYTELWAAML